MSNPGIQFCIVCHKTLMCDLPLPSSFDDVTVFIVLKKVTIINAMTAKIKINNGMDFALLVFTFNATVMVNTIIPIMVNTQEEAYKWSFIFTELKKFLAI